MIQRKRRTAVVNFFGLTFRSDSVRPASFFSLVELRKISSCSTDGELKVSVLRCQKNPLDKTYSASRYELPSLRYVSISIDKNLN